MAVEFAFLWFPCMCTISHGLFALFHGVIERLYSVIVTIPEHPLHSFPAIITKSCLYNVDPLKPHFYIVKLAFTGVYIIFLISAQTHRLWVLVRTASARLF